MSTREVLVRYTKSRIQRFDKQVALYLEGLKMDDIVSRIDNIIDNLPSSVDPLAISELRELIEDLNWETRQEAFKEGEACGVFWAYESIFVEDGSSYYFNNPHVDEFVTKRLTSLRKTPTI